MFNGLNICISLLHVPILHSQDSHISMLNVMRVERFHAFCTVALYGDILQFKKDVSLGGEPQVAVV